MSTLKSEPGKVDADLGERIKETAYKTLTDWMNDPENPVLLPLKPDDVQRFQKAVSEVPYILRDAAEIFDFLWSSVAGGHLEGREGVLLAILSLSGRALRMAADTEGEALDIFGVKLRQALAARSED